MNNANEPFGLVNADLAQNFALELFLAAGLNFERAEAVARLLVLTDMMGRTTHGLAQAKLYLDQLQSGGMSKDSDYQVVRDTGSTIVWDGKYLPGLWLVERALALGYTRVREHGVVTFSIKHSHHIGCLAALVKDAADRGYFVTLLSSGPHGKYVAPFGGTQALFSPNPIAYGIPSSSRSVLVDMTASITTVSMTREKVKIGKHFDRPWMLDSKGQPTTDPRVLEATDPRGSMMLLGGMESGHKGFGLAIMVEALTQALSGHGRKDAPKRWGASVYLQLIDPEAFCGLEAFRAQMDFFIDACHANPPADSGTPVRLPGEQADKNIQAAKINGIFISNQTRSELIECARKLDVTEPSF
jgi:LDH2 family malate/lactate/ureidoglycolate dehydrogenase